MCEQTIMAMDNVSLNLSTPALITNLQLSYKNQQILKGIDLSLERGDVLGLIGRNGAGKSTLINCLMGLLRPQQGSAALFGTPSLALNEACKQALTYVPQQTTAFPWMTVEDSLNLFSQLYEQWDAGYVQKLVNRWELPLKQKIKKLSPGQAQRLTLIRAMAPHPALMIMDEPASALDPLARRDLLRELVSQAYDDGTTVLFSTHIVTDLERISSKVAFLDGGKLLLDHTLENIKENMVRILVPHGINGQQQLPPFPGELKRRVLINGDISILAFTQTENLPEIYRHPQIMVTPLALEDLFIEVVE